MDRSLDFDGSSFLVTGGAEGIGAEIVRQLLENNSRVVIVDPVKPQLIDENSDCVWVKGDVSKPEDCEHAVKEALAKYGKLDGLINNAGISALGGLEDIDSSEKVDQLLKVNLYGTIFMSTACLPALKCNPNGGAIIIISSISAKVINPVIHPAYAASKGGQIAFGRYLAAAYAKYGMRCNVILPGAVGTDLWDTLPPETQKLYADLHPLGVGSVNDVSSLVLFLLSKEACWINGSEMVIDGGNLVAGGLASYAKEVL